MNSTFFPTWHSIEVQYEGGHDRPFQGEYCDREDSDDAVGEVQADDQRRRQGTELENGEKRDFIENSNLSIWLKTQIYQFGRKLKFINLIENSNLPIWLKTHFQELPYFPTMSVAQKGFGGLKGAWSWCCQNSRHCWWQRSIQLKEITIINNVQFSWKQQNYQQRILARGQKWSLEIMMIRNYDD